MLLHFRFDPAIFVLVSFKESAQMLTQQTLTKTTENENKK